MHNTYSNTQSRASAEKFLGEANRKTKTEK